MLAGQSLASMKSHRGEPNHDTQKSRDQMTPFEKLDSVMCSYTSKLRKSINSPFATMSLLGCLSLVIERVQGKRHGIP